MSKKKLVLMSGDGHVGPPTKVYKDYLEKPLHAQFDEFYADHKYRWASASKHSFQPVNFDTKMKGTEGFQEGVGSPVAWDPQMRLKIMDEQGLAADVFFPDDQNTNDPPWGSGLAAAATDIAASGHAAKYPPELVRAGARAYNRWMADFCSPAPDRLRGLTIVGTMDDAIWAADEIRRAYDSGLRTGIMLPLEYNTPMYHHPRYDIVWDTCQELDLTVVVHISRGHPDYLGEDPWVQRFFYFREAQWHAERPIVSLIMGGVLERFPSLRLTITEMGMEWVRPLIDGLDFGFDMWPEFAGRNDPQTIHFSLKPSEYWERQVYVAHTTMQKHEEFEHDLPPNLLFGMDIGHSEGWWPVFGFPEPAPKSSPPGMVEMPLLSIGDALKSLCTDLPAQRMVPYLQDNFFRAYPNVDKAALQSVADRIGPTADELALV